MVDQIICIGGFVPKNINFIVKMKIGLLMLLWFALIASVVKAQLKGKFRLKVSQVRICMYIVLYFNLRIAFQ